MNCKRKGDAGELELLHLLEDRGIECRRNQQGILAGFCGGSGNPDIWARISGRELHIECKRTERFGLYPSLRQAQRDAAGTDAVPIVAHRMNRQPWVVVMALEDFVDLMRAEVNNGLPD